MEDTDSEKNNALGCTHSISSDFSLFALLCGLASIMCVCLLVSRHFSV